MGEEWRQEGTQKQEQRQKEMRYLGGVGECYMLQGGVSLLKCLKAACPEHQRLWVWVWSALPKSDVWVGGGRQRGVRQLGFSWCPRHCPIGSPAVYPHLTGKHTQLCLPALLPSVCTFRTQLLTHY